MNSKRRLHRCLGLMVGGLGVLALWGLRPAPTRAQAEATPEQVFERMAAAINNLKDYRAEWTHYSASSGPNPIWGRKTAAGKFLRSPKLYYEKVIKVEANFSEQSNDGTQMIFDFSTNEQKLLLPGARRLLGVVKLFGEDVKCLWLNGESLQTEALWDRLEAWKKMRASCPMSLRVEPYQGKRFNVISFPCPAVETSGRPQINRLDVWVDPDDNLPRRCQGFVPGNPKPTLDYEITRIEPNVGLTAKDLEFEGLSLWDFPAQFVANSEGLDQVKYHPLPAGAGTAPAFDELLKNYEQAVAGIKDYRAELFLSQKYYRLRSQGTIRASVIREPFFFLFEFGDDFRLNYLHLTSPGGKTSYYANENSYATLGGGAMKVVGVELMHVDDLRADFAFGERFYTLNLFALLDRMKWYARNGAVSVKMVKFGGKDCPAAVMKRKDRAGPAEVQDLVVVFDPGTWLPLRMDYLGLEDKEGFATIEYRSIQTNLGLTDLKF